MVLECVNGFQKDIMGFQRVSTSPINVHQLFISVSLALVAVVDIVMSTHRSRRRALTNEMSHRLTQPNSFQFTLFNWTVESLWGARRDEKTSDWDVKRASQLNALSASLYGELIDVREFETLLVASSNIVLTLIITPATTLNFHAQCFKCILEQSNEAMTWDWILRTFFMIVRGYWVLACSFTEIDMPFKLSAIAAARWTVAKLCNKCHHCSPSTSD